MPFPVKKSTSKCTTAIALTGFTPITPGVIGVKFSLHNYSRSNRSKFYSLHMDSLIESQRISLIEFIILFSKLEQST